MMVFKMLRKNWKMKVDFQFQLWQINSLDIFTLILTTRKSWTNWKTVTFLRSVSKLRSQGKSPPPSREMGRYREAWPRSAYWEQKLLELGTVRNTEGNFAEFWRLNEELESSKFLGTQSRGAEGLSPLTVLGSSSRTLTRFSLWQ